MLALKRAPGSACCWGYHLSFLLFLRRGPPPLKKNKTEQTFLLRSFFFGGGPKQQGMLFVFVWWGEGPEKHLALGVSNFGPSPCPWQWPQRAERGKRVGGDHIYIYQLDYMFFHLLKITSYYCIHLLVRPMEQMNLWPVIDSLSNQGGNKAGSEANGSWDFTWKGLGSPIDWDFTGSKRLRRPCNSKKVPACPLSLSNMFHHQSTANCALGLVHS